MHERGKGLRSCGLRSLAPALPRFFQYIIVLHAHRAQSGVLVSHFLMARYTYYERQTTIPLAPSPHFYFLQSLPFAIFPTFGSSPLSPRSARAISSLSRKGVVMISRRSSGAYWSTANYGCIHHFPQLASHACQEVKCYWKSDHLHREQM